MIVLVVLGGLLGVCAVVYGATFTPRPPQYVGRHRPPGGRR